MTLEWLWLGIATALATGPFVLQRYLERLPVAPACPDCRAMTREVSRRWSGLLALPGAIATVVRECMRCGWRGRMRWRWAPHSVRGDGR